MTGYAVYSATLGPQSIPGVPENARASREASICIALADDHANPVGAVLDDIRALGVTETHLVGAINLSELRWASFSAFDLRRSHDFLMDGHAYIANKEVS